MPAEANAFRADFGLRHIVRYAQLPIKALLAAAALLLLDAAAGLATPLIVALVTGHILGQPQLPQITLGSLLATWAVLIVTQAAIRYFSTLQLGRTAAAVGAQLRLRTYEHIQSLPVAFFNNREHGDILSLLSEDIRRISTFLTATATEIAPHLITVLGATIIVLNIDPITGVAALALVPVILLLIRQTGKAANPLSRALAETHASHASLTEENLRLNRLIKSFTREQVELQRYQDSNSELLQAEVRHLRISNRITPLVQIATGLAVVGLVWLGAQRIESGTLQPAQLIALIMYGFMLFRPLHALGSSYGNFQSARGASGRLTELLDECPEPDDGETGYSAVGKGIRFEDVCYGYTGRNPVLNRINAFIPAGQVTVLLGENGVGKTTMIHLLLRFMRPDQGRITIDDTDIQGFSLASIRERIAYVPQEVALVSGSITDNILYGLPDASSAEVSKAAESALVTDFARHLPHGLNTPVGPGGVRLSGGQRQRIALARALLKNADILVLDEPTSMFDPGSEDLLLQQLLEPLHGKTVIAVTHRSALLAFADNIILLNEDSGTT